MKDYSVLDELVPKTQELHRAIFDKGYEQGEKDILEQLNYDSGVSRQAVLSYITNDLGFGDEENGYDLVRKIAQEEIYNFVKKMPSVMPKKKTGKWIDDANKIDAQFGRHTYICSECGKYAEHFISGTEVWWDRIKPNFCPNCGARMEVSE